MSFSAVTERDLKDLGVKRSFLSFDDGVIGKCLVTKMKDNQFEEVSDALSQDITEIYDHVNMMVRHANCPYSPSLLSAPCCNHSMRLVLE